MKGMLGIGAAVFAVPALIIALVLGLTSTDSGCGTAASATSTSGTVADYTGDQLENAAAIMSVAAARGLPVQAQVVAVATAMGESSLHNIGYGDWETSGVTNPDGSPTTSIGLFQQQDSWGTREQRLDPATSAGLFLDRLVAIEGWQTLPVTIAAHRVQGNAAANHYAQFEAAAREVVAALSGTAATDTGSTCGSYPPATGSEPGPWGGFENGRVNTNILVAIPWQSNSILRTDATAALIVLNDAFKTQFGYDLPINDGYRAYDEQIQAKAIYGDEAATPGTSNHGWALAIDVGDRQHNRIGYGDVIYQWLKANAGRFGWAHPDWAEPDGAGPHEAWHWEYYGTPSA